MKNNRRYFTHYTELILILLIIVLCAILSQVNDGFLTMANFRSLLKGFTIEGFALIGMCFLLITGTFDISVASVTALSSFAFASLAITGMSILFCMIIAICLGAGVGAVNGIVVAKIGVNPFITTLATMTIVRGLVLAVSQGNPIRMSSDAFRSLSWSEFHGIPVIFIIFVIVVIVVDYLLRRIRWFRQLFFIGGNEYSAELTGINVRTMRIILFIIMGALAALSGIFSASRLEGSVPTAYVGMEMKLIVACVIGGCSLNGGQGSLFGAVLGLIFLFILDNGMVMMQINIYWFQGVLGVFLIGVVLINTLLKKGIIGKSTTVENKSTS